MYFKLERDVIFYVEECENKSLDGGNNAGKLGRSSHIRQLPQSTRQGVPETCPCFQS